MERNPWFRALIVLAVFALLIHLGGQLWQMAQHFGDIIVVFFLAWLLAFILSPVAHFLEHRYRISRSLAAAGVYLTLFLGLGIAFVLVVPLAVEQLVQLGQRLPDFVATAQGWMAFVQAELENRGIPVDLMSFYKGSDLATQIASLGSGIVTNTIAVVGSVASVLFSITIVLVLSFYLVADGERLQKRLSGFVPADYRLESQFFLDSINRTFGGWLRGTLLISAVYAVGNALVMAIAGLSYVLLGSLLAGVLMIIPLIGPVLAMVMPVLLAALQGDVTKVVLVVVGLLVLQTLVFNVLSPKVMGESIGMHPLLVLLALLVGIKQAGLAGAIFGVPVVGVIYAMLMYLLEKRTPSQDVSAWPEAPAPPTSREHVGITDSGRPAAGSPGVVDRLAAAVRAIAARLRALLGRGQGGYGTRLRPGD